MQRIISVIAFAVFAAPVILAQDAADKAREKLAGHWSGYAVIGKGEKPDEGPVRIELTITKDLIKATGYKGKEKMDLGAGTFELKLDKAPFYLDGDKQLANPNRKEIWLGIYQLDGDTLKWCMHRKARPKEFETKDGAYLLILKRQSN